MPDCRKTEVFLAEWERMCDTVKICGDCDIRNIVDCGKCTSKALCMLAVLRSKDAAIKIVQKWSDEHPRVARDHTYFTEFYTRNPDCVYSKAAIAKYLCRDIMFCNCQKNNCGNADDKFFDKCFECWNEPYEEDEK